MTTKTVLSERHYRAGYVIREERVDGKEFSMDDFTIKSSYTPSGDYIGDPKTAYTLCKKRGISPEKAQPDHKVCSIGFNEEEQKWYGWSHRAVYGFRTGHVAQKGNCECTSGCIDDIDPTPGKKDTKPVKPGFTAKTIHDCKTLAVAFAGSVS